ncbi:hypothetical protein HanRHA438_Chr08g0369171 [Helianthus annuus]|nr:hypothetical protein HanIR_Chr08g0385331 [Helianthus annuus]KAJ0899490.1 hypothetical protein HanRHA438_Chr08g0369171 [Helianthus annuus]
MLFLRIDQLFYVTTRVLCYWLRILFLTNVLNTLILIITSYGNWSPPASWSQNLFQPSFRWRRHIHQKSSKASVPQLPSDASNWSTTVSLKGGY